MSYWVKCESEAKFCHGMSNVRPDPSPRVMSKEIYNLLSAVKTINKHNKGF